MAETVTATEIDASSAIGKLVASFEQTPETPAANLAEAVTETKTEAPIEKVDVETPVIKLEETKKVEQEKEFEPFTELFEEPKTPTETKLVEVKTENLNPEEKYKAELEKAKEYDTITSIPAVKALTEFFKSGKTDLNEFIKEAGIENVDKKSSVEIFEQSLKDAGYAEDVIASEVEEFKDLSVVKQDMHVKPIREQMKKAQEEKLRNFTAGVPQVDTAEVQRFETVKQTTLTNLNKSVNDLKGKKYDGVLEITEEMIPHIIEEAKQYSKPVFEDGKVVGYDLKTGIKAAINTLYDKQIKKALITQTQTEAFMEWYRKRTRPDTNENSTQAPAVGDGVKEAMTEFIKKAQGG